MNVTLLGIVIEVKDVQKLNAPEQMYSNVLGIDTLMRELHARDPTIAIVPYFISIEVPAGIIPLYK